MHTFSQHKGSQYSKYRGICKFIHTVRKDLVEINILGGISILGGTHCRRKLFFEVAFWYVDISLASWARFLLRGMGADRRFHPFCSFKFPTIDKGAKGPREYRSMNLPTRPDFEPELTTLNSAEKEEESRRRNGSLLLSVKKSNMAAYQGGEQWKEWQFIVWC